MKELTDPAKIKAAAAYNAAADHFDKVAYWDWYGRRTVERLGLAAGSIVLDVACGSGASAIPAAEIVAESGSQALRSPEDWWTMALGGGFRWTIDQMGPEAAARVRETNLQWLRDHGVQSLELNVIYAIATKKGK